MNIETDAVSGVVKITAVAPNTAAYRANIPVGCELVKIGSAPTYAMGHDAMLEALKVNPVQLTIKRAAASAASRKSGERVITKDGNGKLGMGFATGPDGHTVNKLAQGGAAWQADIRVGDRILKVNGRDATVMQANDVLDLISGPRSGPVIKLAIHVDAGAGTNMVVSGISSVHSGVEPLGISVATEGGAHVITKAQKSSAGWRMGLRVGDNILDINSRAMAGVTHEALLSALQDGGAELMMVVRRGGAQGRTHKLKNRSAFIQDLGLIIEVTKKGLVQVKDVKPGTAADAAQLSVGDVIIDINGKTVLKKSLTQVIATLRSELGPDVNMVVCSQPHEAVLERDYETKKHQPAASGKKAKRPKYTVEVKREIAADGFEPLGLALVTEGSHHICGQVGRGPAFRAGVRQGDYLTAINGVKMTKRDHEHVLQTLKETTESFTISFTRAAGEQGPQKAFAEPAAAPAADDVVDTVITEDFEEVAF